MQKELENKWGFSSFYILLLFLIISAASISKQLLMHFNNVGNNHSVFIFSVFLTYFFLIFTARKISLWMFLPVLFIGISFLQASLFADQSWDGLAYHQKAAWFLMHGGNLLFDGNSGNIWVSLYPKSTWYFAGEVGLQFGSLLFGSAYQLLIGLAMYSYIIFFFGRNGYSPFLAHIFAILSLFSPIYIAQAFSYYVDATVGFLALMMMLSSLEFGNSRKRFDACILVLSSVIIVNIKFSGFLYVGVCFLILGLRSLPKIKETLNVCMIFMVFIIIGTCVIGANPYLKNVVGGKNIFYPLFGESKQDIITFAQPVSFNHMNRFEKLALSVFSQSENINKASGKNPQLKIPGEVHHREIKQLSYEDLRIGGFGPLYSLALVLAIAFLIYLRGIDKNCLLLIAMITLSTLLNPEAWWARYAPHLYTFLLLPLMSIKKDSTVVWENRIIGFIVAVLFVNVFMMTASRLKSSYSFNSGVNEILKSCKNKTLHIAPNNNFLIEPIAQRGNGPYVIENESAKNSKNFNRKFNYWCE